MKKIRFLLTAFRDGFQSVYGARVFSKDYLDVVAFAARECGIKHLEAGGGAMFQSPFFYARENAFDVMDAFRQAAGPDADLQTLARGINVVALKAQPRDVVKLHADLFRKHGMTTIRNFDALNDVQNLIGSGQCIKDAGLKHEVAVTMMELPPGCSGAHDVPFYEQALRRILDAGIPFDSVAFKDASGTSRPRKVHETICMARRLLGNEVKLAFHSHETAGTGCVSYVAAIEAGADQVDVSLAPVSGGTCQPDLITLWHALRGSEYSLEIDIAKIIQLEERLKEAMKDYFLPPEATKVEPLIPFFPMPGGALTANTQMLRDNGLMDRYPEVIAAMGEAVKKGGFGTSVTPVSQFYFQQAFNNVVFGPWKKIAEGYGKMVLGYFGKTPVPPDPEVLRAAEEQLRLPPTTQHLEALEKDPQRGLKAARAVLEREKLPVTDENLFIVASCEEKGVAFLKGQGMLGVRKNQPKTEAPSTATTVKPNVYQVTVSGQSYKVKLEGNTAVVNETPYAIEVHEITEEARAAQGPVREGTPVITQLPGLVLRVQKQVGAAVQKGEILLVIESMKMENNIVSPVAGKLAALLVQQGEQVPAGKTLAVVK
ncbi:MAG TPA: biotin attachment protein [Candidatus Paceibacterota bacterium]|nr:biotin attachment protein [Verrucomicrobiota bacterium]HRY52145.1 biotin attachment protein [Candidatus Paceibacterota bacterium]